MIGKKEFRQKGYGKEALKAVENLAKSCYSFKTLVAKIKINNEASKNFFLKNNFENTGTINEEFVFKKKIAN